VVGEHSFKRIIAGKQHTCALTSTGVAYCWAMHVGEPGEPTRGLVPGLVSTALRFDALTAGSQYACGISGTLGYCWGENRHGRFGNGTDVLFSVTPGSLAGAHPFAQLSAGETHACGVTPEGTVYCWGSNLLGQLGVGIQSTGSNVPTRVHH
jgi:alpha-tubulin suppressor-like RCC1 family protein